MSKVKSSPNVVDIPINQIEDNPLNDELFRRATESEMNALYHSVQKVGIVNIATVYPVHFGTTTTYKLISGHNRKKILALHEELGIETMRCEVIQKPSSQAAEMLMMVAHNLGRGVKDTWAIKVYKHVRQILRQLMKSGENGVEIADSNFLEEIDSHSVATSHIPEVVDLFIGYDYENRRMADVIRDVLGLTHRQQRCLAWLTDAALRDKLYKRIQKAAKIKKDAVAQWESGFEKISFAVEADEITLHEATKYIEAFIAEIEALEQKKQPKPAKQEKPAKQTKVKAKAEEIVIEVDDGESSGGALLRHNRMDSAEVLEYFGISMDDYTDGDVVVLTPDTFAIRAADVCFIISNHDLLEWLTTGA
ncbi:MAG: hypothetical protein JNL32_15390 [Candidatus Kapabacteria bacterium]|nr:hypothetical protein [Candidatus Kapabacteria bacterium]